MGKFPAMSMQYHSHTDLCPQIFWIQTKILQGAGNTFAMDLYINAVDSGPVAVLTGGTDVSDTNPALNIDFTAGDKLRLRADQTAGVGNMGDTTVALMVKWRS